MSKFCVKRTFDLCMCACVFKWVPHSC